MDNSKNYKLDSEDKTSNEKENQEEEPKEADPELITTIEKGIGFGEDYKQKKD